MCDKIQDAKLFFFALMENTAVREKASLKATGKVRRTAIYGRNILIVLHDNFHKLVCLRLGGIS